MFFVSTPTFRHLYRSRIHDGQLSLTNVFPFQRIEKLQPMSENVLSNIKLRIGGENVKKTFESMKLNKGAEMDTIEIIGQSASSRNNLGFIPNNSKSSDNETPTSKYVQKYIGIKPKPANIDYSIPKIQTPPTKKSLPTTSMKKARNTTSPLKFVKILPKIFNISKQQTQTTSSIGRDISLGKGIPIQNFIVNSQENVTNVSNKFIVGQAITQRTHYVPQPTNQDLHKQGKLAQFNVVTDDTPIVQNITKHEMLPDRNKKPNYKQTNTGPNVQPILTRKELLPQSVEKNQILASTPILNLPINVLHIKTSMSNGTEKSQKCIFLKSRKIQENPQADFSICAKEQAKPCNSKSNLSYSARKDNQVQPQSKVLMGSINNNIRVRQVNAAKDTLNNNPTQIVDKSGPNVLHTFNVSDTSSTVENYPSQQIAATAPLISPSKALSKPQENLNEKNRNTTDNRNELKEMLMDEHELDQLLLLAEKMKQEFPTTGLQNKPNLVESGKYTHVEIIVSME